MNYNKINKCQTRSPRAISRDYARWIDTRIKQFADQERSEWQPLENYLQWNAMFITFMFDKRKIARRKYGLNDSSGGLVFGDGKNVDRQNKDALTPEFFSIDRFYKKMCRAVLGSNYSRHREEQPLMIAAADVNGTRYWRTSGQIENLHVHSIWVFKKGQIETARRTLSDFLLSCRENEFDFDSIDVTDIDQYECHDEPSKLSSYISKFHGFNAHGALVPQDIAIYPR